MRKKSGIFENIIGKSDIAALLSTILHLLIHHQILYTEQRCVERAIVDHDYIHIETLKRQLDGLASIVQNQDIRIKFMDNLFQLFLIQINKNRCKSIKLH
jgi:hypothetical protein